MRRTKELFIEPRKFDIVTQFVTIYVSNISKIM